MLIHGEPDGISQDQHHPRRHGHMAQLAVDSRQQHTLVTTSSTKRTNSEEIGEENHYDRLVKLIGAPGLCPTLRRIRLARRTSRLFLVCHAWQPAAQHLKPDSYGDIL